MKRKFFFQYLTLAYMTKTLNQFILFSSTKIRIFFSATLGIRIFFLEKNHNPPFKLNGRSLIYIICSEYAIIWRFLCYIFWGGPEPNIIFIHSSPHRPSYRSQPHLHILFYRNWSHAPIIYFVIKLIYVFPEQNRYF